MYIKERDKTEEKPCPICFRKITGENCWVKYHVSYKPEITILACKFCNYVENKLRHNERVSTRLFSRVKAVILFHNKLGFKI